MAERDTIEVSTDEILDLGSPDIPSTLPKPCQLVPPCKEGNHGVIAPDRKRSHEKIGKCYYTEEALKHDLGALKSGKVYTKKEFYRRARAWYKADIDRILHWHRVYKEQNPEKPKMPEEATPNREQREAKHTEAEQPSGKQELVQERKKEEEKKEEEKKGEEKKEEEKKEEEKKEEEKKEEEKKEEEKKEEEKKEEEKKEEEKKEEEKEEKPKSRSKKEKAQGAPTRVQPPRAAKRKAVEPPPPARATKKKKRKIEDTIEAAAPTPPPETDLAAVDESRLRPVEIEVDFRIEQHVLDQKQPVPEEQPPTEQQQEQAEPKEQDTPQKIQSRQESAEETKGDYQLDLEEWMIFLARYNSATTPVTPTPDPTSLSAFTAKQLQGLDVANFIIRLERIIETKINDLISERQGITIDAGAGGGLCLTGFYHHPYKCALDGNYVPPPKFEAAGGYVPGEDWKPEEEKVKEQEKECDGSDGKSRSRKEDDKKEEDWKDDHQKEGELKEDDVKVDSLKEGDRNEDIRSTTGVVSSPRYRPPGSGKRSTERPFRSSSVNPSVPGSPGASQATSPPALSLEAALHRQAQAVLEEQSGERGDMDEPFQPSQQLPALPHLPALPRLAPRNDVDNASRSTSMRNSPAPEAAMEISPTLGRWRPSTPGLPLENFDDAVVDVAGLRFAVDLCAGYLGDGRSARIFML